MVMSCSSADEQPDFCLPGQPCAGAVCVTDSDCAPLACQTARCTAGGACVSFPSGGCDCAECGSELTVVDRIRHRDGGLTGLKGARAIAASADGRHVYVAATGADSIAVLGWSDGKLTPMPVATVPGVPAVSGLALFDEGRALVAGSLGAGHVAVFARDAESGRLAAIQVVGDGLTGTRHLTASGSRILVAHDSGVTALAAVGSRLSLESQVPLREAAVVRSANGATWAGGADGTFELTSDGPLSVVRSVESVGEVTGLQIAADGAVVVASSTGVHLIAKSGVPSNAKAVLPHGVDHGYDDSDHIAVDAVALVGGSVLGTAYYGGYLVMWDRAGDTLVNARALTYQPAFADDHFDIDLGGQTIGYDVAEDRRVVAIEPRPGGWIMTSGLWDTVVAISGAGGVTSELQEGQGGVTDLGGAYSIAPSPDEAHLYVAAWNVPDVTALSRDPATGLLTRLPPPAGVPIRPIDYGLSDVAVAADGSQVLGVDDEFNLLHVYDRAADTGQLTFRKTVGEGVGHETQVAVAISPDGAHVYTGGFDSDTMAHFHRTPDGEVQLAQILLDNKGGIDGLDGLEDIVVAPDGTVHVAAFEDGSVTVFSADVKTTLRSIAHKSLYAVEAIAMSPDASRMVAVCPPTSTIVQLDRNSDGDLEVVAWKKWPGVDWGPERTGDPSPGRVVLSADAKTAWVTFRLWDGVARFGLEPALTYEKSVHKGAASLTDGLHWPNGITRAGDHIYVTSMLGDSVSVLTR